MRAAPSITSILARSIATVLIGVIASIPPLLVAATPSGASYLLDPDMVCAPTDTVCVIDGPWTVLRDEPLDFGRRRVVVRGDGHLQGELELRCGSFEVDVDDQWMQISQKDHDLPGISVSARRGCSGDPAVPCLSDDECQESDLGTCRVGNASISIFGSTSAPNSMIRLHAADSVTIAGPLDISGVPAEDYPDYNGGYADLHAVAGSVLLLAPILGNAGPDTRYGGYGFSGDIYVTAGKDISIWQPVHLVGGGGSLNLDAGRNIRIRAPVLGYGLEGNASGGVWINAEAGRDIVVEPPPARKSLPFRLHGGFYTDSDGSNAGSGGNGDLTAGRDIVIAEGVRIGADSGRSYGYVDDTPYGGAWVVHAGDDIRFDGRLSVRGRGIFGESEGVEFSAGSTLTVGSAAKINLRSDYIGEIILESRNRGDVTIEGQIDARAHDSLDSDGYYSGSGGSLFLDGGNVDFRGLFETGGGYSSGNVLVQACRLHLGGSSRIDAGMGAQDDDSGEFEIEIGESMIADPGSVLASHAKASPGIVYRDAAKPPHLLGTVPPNLALKVASSLEGCPVCGNAEIDEGEACDDGNLDHGDGCSETCAVEP